MSGDNKLEVLITGEDCFKCKKKFFPCKTTKKCTSCNVYICNAEGCAFYQKYTHVGLCKNYDHSCHTCKKALVYVNAEPFLENDEIWKTYDDEGIPTVNDTKLVRLIGTLIEKTRFHESKYNELMEVKVKSMEQMFEQNKELIETMKRENKELKHEMDLVKRENQMIKRLFVNIEDPKEIVKDDTVVEKISKEHEGNVELKTKFDEFEEYSQMIKNLELDQVRIKEECKGIEEMNTEACGTFERELEEMRDKIDTFVAEVKSDLKDKKNHLIKEMKANIEKLQEQHKESVGQIRKLQQQNIKRSKVLQNELLIVKDKFEGSIQLKEDLNKFYETDRVVSIKNVHTYIAGI